MQRVFAADPKDTINAACGEQFLRIPSPWDFPLWTHRRLLRIPSTQHVCAAAPENTIDWVCLSSDYLRIPSTQRVCAAALEDTIDAACVCSGSCGFYRRFVCVQRLLRIPSTRRVCAASPKDTINEACLCSGS
ncbi:hypothetical protein ACOMHN_006208 [Nucella lapillus]